ncbi:tetraacyldisaccharide 4'-kinase [Legionella impletisoli]|uniref:Tetraacyldisaccharide 4'-kinase n=1 Tax=Legionella impletisoli TaxID=343510 RepID=A0A917JNW0_9GAMM|nr:tetraacyldisaccharide 4'-kinase [Legionella impletisoli]GGI79312.1 tetraacyldisaccharide 4'-kinase [Legionella impletisoli]
MQSFLNTLWYSNHVAWWLLYPFSLAFQVVASLRKWFLCRFKQISSPVPIIVVGNLTVGGVGKTPLVIALANKLRQQGFKVGIVSRGYGAQNKVFPQEVYPESNPSQVGDEPVLIAQRTGCPVVIAPNRVSAVNTLLDKYSCDFIISDDGLQHYRMGRAMEIVVIDGYRGLGNRLCLPAGPLRESPKRLKTADLIVVNGGEWHNAYRMDLMPGEITSLKQGQTLKLTQLKQPVAAFAGIGNPNRFFSLLDALKINYQPYTFPDHYRYESEKLIFSENTMLMTEKDAVKCREFAAENMYFLPVEAHLNEAFWNAFLSFALRNCKETAAPSME